MQKDQKSQIIEQITSFLLNSEEELKDLSYGSLEFSLRNGVIYNLLITKSVLVKKELLVKGNVDETKQHT